MTAELLRSPKHHALKEWPHSQKKKKKKKKHTDENQEQANHDRQNTCQRKTKQLVPFSPTQQSHC